MIAGVDFVIEGQNRPEKGDIVEYRSSGPIWTQLTRKTWRGELLVNILVKVVKNEKDYHKIYRVVGKVESAFIKCVPIKKYGNEVGDDRTVTIGQLLIVEDTGKDIETTHFGQLAPDIPSIQSTVQATYRCELRSD